MALLFTINAASCTCRWEPRRGPRRRKKKMDSELNNNFQNKSNGDAFKDCYGLPVCPSHAGEKCGEHEKCSLSKSISKLELQEYDRPPGKEKNNLVKCEDLEHYVKTMTENHGFKDQYNIFRFGPQKATVDGVKAENKPKNRYMDLLPYDETRVILQQLKDDPNSDYINANYCDAYNNPNGYICTQGPLEKTVNDFWRMVWQEFVCKIVMAANIIEFGKKKCEKYWPDSTTKYGDILVTLQSEDIFLDYTIRTFKVQKIGKSCRRVVRQYHFTGWPDHGVPVYPLSLIHMLNSIKNFQPNSKGPVVLHCSAGVGRSGTVMLLDSAYDMALTEKKVDTFALLYRMRQQRINLVETLEQYTFVHKTLVECLFGDVPRVPASHLVMYYNKLRLTEKDNAKTRLQLQYERLAQLTPPLPNERFIAAQAPDYKCKNRTDLILSPECGRPVLRAGAAQNYINAVYVNGYGKENAFLATQFPLHETLKDFWQLVYETNARTIVTLNEIPKNDETCPIFWPESGSVYHGSIKLDHTTTDEVPNFKIRQLKLKNVDESKRSRTVKQFHVTGWSKDDAAPPSIDGIIRLLIKVEKWQAKSGNHPVIVCCFNGNKACGLYCASSYISDHILNEKEIDVFTAVRTIRLNRPQFVPKEQYRWLYEIACALSKAYGHC